MNTLADILDTIDNQPNNVGFSGRSDIDVYEALNQMLTIPINEITSDDLVTALRYWIDEQPYEDNFFHRSILRGLEVAAEKYYEVKDLNVEMLLNLSYKDRLEGDVEQLVIDIMHEIEYQLAN